MTNQLEDKKARLLRLNFFIGQLVEMNDKIEAFDPIFWNLHLDCVEVGEEGLLNYHFKNSTTITI